MIWVIVFLGVILRLIAINQSVWLDEAISLVSAKNLSFSQIVYELGPFDVHPPGYYLLLKVWVLFLGDSEIISRTLSVIFGVSTIYITYLLAEKFFSRKVGYLSALFMAISPLGVYYSQEIRMYCAAAFFSALSFLFLIQIIEKKKFSSLFYIISNLAVLSLDYMAYLIFPAQLIYIIFLKKKYLKRICTLLLISVLFALPWLILLPSQLIKGKYAAENLPLWGKIVGGNSIKDLGLIFAKNIVGRISFENKILYGGFVGFFSVLYLYFLYLAWRVKEAKIFFCWLLLPIFLAFVISFFLPVFAYHRFIFVLPALYILIAVGVLNLRKFSTLISLVITLISLTSLGYYYMNPKFQREHWRQAFEFILEKKSSSIVLFEDNHKPPPFIYYDHFSKIKAYPGLKKIPANSPEDIVTLENIEKGKSLLVFEYLFQINDPNQILIKEVENSGYKRINTYDFAGVGFIYEYQYFDRM